MDKAEKTFEKVAISSKLIEDALISRLNNINELEKKLTALDARNTLQNNRGLQANLINYVEKHEGSDAAFNYAVNLAKRIKEIK